MNKSENIGALRHRVTIHRYTTTRGDYGAETVFYVALATVWANYEYRVVPSGEKQMTDQKTAVAAVNWTMRYRDDVEPKMRLVDESNNIYDILSINYDTTKMYMVLECQNVGEAGVIVGVPAPGSVDTMTRVYKQKFTGAISNAVTITVNGGVLPSDTDNILCFVNGQETDEFTVSGSVITFGFTVYGDDTVRVVFFP